MSGHNNQISKIKYFTTPIFYTNDKPHLGHAHTCFLADFFSKTFKNFGYKVFFATGTDEHGQKIMNTAQNLGITPKQLVDENSQVFKNFMKDFNINYDYFIRTTDDNHKENVLKIWKQLEKNGYLYLGIYKGLYAEKDECFYSIEETKLNDDGQRIAISSNNTVEEMEEECYFFQLSAFKEQLLQFYANHDFTIPSYIKNELVGFVTNLKDLCVSRKIDWGIKIPNTDSTIYVWIDALANYLTIIGGIDNFNQEFWDNSIHIVGKDIVIFHGVYWPAILMALNMSPPKHLLVHGWWLCGNEKMSKSKKNVLDPYHVENKEYLRYYCLHSDLIGHDGNFQLSHMINIINNELIGKTFNLYSRVFALISKHYGLGASIQLTKFTDRKNIQELNNKCLIALEKYSPREYISVLIEYSNICNQYIDKEMIWKDLTLEHLNFLLPLMDQILRRSEGVLVETYYKIKSFYKLENSNSDNCTFTLIKLENFFTKMTLEEEILT